MFDKNIGYFTLLRQVKKKWGIKGGLTLMDVGHAFYVARFTNKKDYDHVLTQGPWMIGDHYLIIRKWVPNFLPTDEPIRHLTTWIRIPRLSVEYYHEDILRKIGSKVGKVIRIDEPTTMSERGQFIRMSVEVDLIKPLLSEFQMNGKDNTVVSKPFGDGEAKVSQVPEVPKMDFSSPK
ncbi:uncharacterized protein LOC141620492 [Silene latifolia]|uniref:uncharacterized protein LOC141620492 n=1 Tax=Silene latifolia TaxID=37657 RepID=UPI003D76EEED